MLEDLPDQLVINISKLKIGDSILVSDLINDKITFLDNPNSIIVGVFAARAAVVEEGADEEEESTEGSESSEEKTEE